MYKSPSAAAIAMVLLAVLSGLLFGQVAPAGPSSGKTAGEAFHNVQVLKDVPSEDLVPAMQFITYSLGVECSYCHVEGAMEKDDKKPKVTARKMMQMMAAINFDNFDGRQEVTCNSCHHGSPHPVSTPVIADVPVKPEATSATAPAGGPPAEEIIAKYADAIGGAAALGKINTRQEKGTITIGGHNLPVEILRQSGGKQLTLIHLPNGDNATAFDGTSGWTSSPNRPARPIPAAEVTSARVETDLQLPLHMKQLFTTLRSVAPETIAGRETNVVAGMNSGGIAAKFYFDKDSGQMLRILRYTKSPLGRNPTQIDYEDYRSQDGVRVPFRVITSRPNSRLTVQLEEVKFNVPVDDAKFAQPLAEAGPKQTSP
jgi:photosynthetic reaction center cytochrome c subunit